MMPKTLQKILGHSNIGMTMNLYVHITEEEKQKLVALGVIDLGKIEQTQRLMQAKKQRDAAKVQNDKAQELEQQVEQALEQQKKRGKKDEGR